MSAWRALAIELDAWHAQRRTASFWWRDDDAVAVTPRLETLLSLTGGGDIVPALAVIPARAEAALAARLVAAPAVVLQHGYAHANHAPPAEKKAELGAHRDVPAMARELARGWRRLSELFDHPLPVLVPPWNRIAPELLARLPAQGLGAVSAFGPRRAARDCHGLHHVNAHIDPVAWRSGRGYVGDREALGQVCAHLRARRNGNCDIDEPTGLLTHHLVQDAGCWTFCRRLAQVTGAHPGARWLHPLEVFRQAG